MCIGGATTHTPCHFESYYTELINCPEDTNFLCLLLSEMQSSSVFRESVNVKRKTRYKRLKFRSCI